MATVSTEVDYPSSDGKPMGETSVHKRVIVESMATLHSYFHNVPNVVVEADLLMYYDEGNKFKVLVPDVFVTFGIPRHDRETYLVWEEGKAPDFILEVTSKSTRRVDLYSKRKMYQNDLKIPEYFLFDPRSEYLRPSLQGFRLVGGRYVAIESVNGRLPSETIGLHLEPLKGRLGFYDPITESLLRTPHKEALHQVRLAQNRVKSARERARLERERAKSESERARSEYERAESEKIARVRALEEAQRAQEEAQRAQEEAQRAQAEAQRAQAEAQRAQAEAQRAQEEAQRAQEETQRAQEVARRAEEEMRLALENARLAEEAIVEERSAREHAERRMDDLLAELDRMRGRLSES